MAADERRTELVVHGVKRLLELGTPDSEILSTLASLGLAEEEASKALAAAKAELVATAPGQRQESDIQGAQWRFPETWRHAETPLWKKILSLGRSYVPRLRTGGKALVKEIIVQSPLDTF